MPRPAPASGRAEAAPAISVITASRNRREALLRKLESLRRQTLAPERFEWIVCLDASDDGSREALGAERPPFRLVVTSLPARGGAAAARNAAADLARGAVLYLSDDDCLLAPDTLERHLAAQRGPCVAVGGIRFVDGAAETEWRPRRVGYWNVNGANTSLPAAAFRAVGGFDESLTHYGGEDLLLGYLLDRHGLPVRFVPGAPVIHLGPDPQASADLGKAEQAGRNAARIASRYPELTYRLGVHPLLLRAELFAERLVPRAPGRLLGEFAYARGALSETRSLRAASRRVLVVSNGHGEDTIGAALAEALREQGLDPHAIPLVGRGGAYERLGFPVLGPRQDLPSGGFLYQGADLVRQDLRAGLIGATVAQWRALARAAASSAAVIAVGDWYALLSASLFGPRPLFHMQPAISVLAWPEDMPAWRNPYGPLERRLMRRARAVWPRDEASAAWLRQRGIDSVDYLGNPMLDALHGQEPLDAPPPYLLLLPGTRDDVTASLPVMLEACRSLGDTGLTPVVAWAAGDPGRVAAPGWRCEPTGREAGVTHLWRHRDGTTVRLARHAFATALRGAAVALSTSGTAAEQAAGFGVPLVGFPTPGPQYTESFARAQRRALGAALTLTSPDPAAVAAAARRLASDEAARRLARDAGRRAMGEPGAARRMATVIAQTLKEMNYE